MKPCPRGRILRANHKRDIRVGQNAHCTLCLLRFTAFFGVLAVCFVKPGHELAPIDVGQGRAGSGIETAGFHILGGQPRPTVENILFSPYAAVEEVHNLLYGDSHSAYGWLAGEDLRIFGDAVEQVHVPVSRRWSAAAILCWAILTHGCDHHRPSADT